MSCTWLMRYSCTVRVRMTRQSSELSCTGSRGRASCLRQPRCVCRNAATRARSASSRMPIECSAPGTIASSTGTPAAASVVGEALRLPDRHDLLLGVPDEERAGRSGRPGWPARHPSPAGTRRRRRRVRSRGTRRRCRAATARRRRPRARPRRAPPVPRALRPPRRATPSSSGPSPDVPSSDARLPPAEPPNAPMRVGVDAEALDLFGRAQPLHGERDIVDRGREPGVGHEPVVHGCRDEPLAREPQAHVAPVRVRLVAARPAAAVDRHHRRTRGDERVGRRAAHVEGEQRAVLAGAVLEVLRARRGRPAA